jgi:hypothetical protein
MRAFALVVGLMAGIVLTGCAKRPAPIAPPPPGPAQLSASDLAAIRADWQKNEPGSRVGVVGAVRTANKWAAIEDINVEGVRDGDVVSIVGVEDGKQNTIAGARVIRIDGKILVVEYTPVSGATRDPGKGDLGIIFGKK